MTDMDKKKNQNEESYGDHNTQGNTSGVSPGQNSDTETGHEIKHEEYFSELGRTSLKPQDKNDDDDYLGWNPDEDGDL